jgi:hypothetical protein
MAVLPDLITVEQFRRMPDEGVPMNCIMAKWWR